MDTYATASYLRSLLNSGVTFEADVRTTNGAHYARLGVYNVDDLGIRADATGYAFVLIPWAAIESVFVQITN
jgi:hypothetical protein